MAKAVIDRFEAVEIDEDNCSLARTVVAYHTIKMITQRAAVWEYRQRILVRLLPKGPLRVCKLTQVEDKRGDQAQRNKSGDRAAKYDRTADLIPCLQRRIFALRHVDNEGPVVQWPHDDLTRDAVEIAW